MERKICGIYKITNIKNGKIYIGQSIDIHDRFQKHTYNSRYLYKKNHLYSAIRKYGIDNFNFNIIVECDENIMDEFERRIIKLYNTTNSIYGYNKTFGGSNGRPTEETRKKQSNSKLGNTCHLGIKHSEETKKRISDSRIGLKYQRSSGYKCKSKELLFDGRTFCNKTEIIEYLGISKRTLYNRINSGLIVISKRSSI